MLVGPPSSCWPPELPAAKSKITPLWSLTCLMVIYTSPLGTARGARGDLVVMDEAEVYAAELLAAFGRHSKRARQDLDLSQRGIAQRMGLTKRAVSSLELGQGNPTLLTMAKVSRLLGMTVPAMLQPYNPRPGARP
jgi:DNA-binding XRE family transcriptional regulator